MLVLLALCANWWQEAQEPELVAIVRAPIAEAPEACAQPAGSPLDVRPEEARDTGERPEARGQVRCPMPASVLAERPSGTVRLDRGRESAFEVAAFDAHGLVVA